MSQYRISKKRLAEIIKEEYRSLHEPTRTDEVLEGEFGPGIGTGLDDQISEVLNYVSTDLAKSQDALTYFIKQGYEKRISGTDLTYSPAASRWLAERGLLEAAKPDFADLNDDGDKEEPMTKAAKEKNLKKESLDSIRNLIWQELKNL